MPTTRSAELDRRGARGASGCSYGFANADIAATAVAMDRRGVVVGVTTP
jgi:hypothetical protein